MKGKRKFYSRSNAGKKNFKPNHSWTCCEFLNYSSDDEDENSVSKRLGVSLQPGPSFASTPLKSLRRQDTSGCSDNLIHDISVTFHDNLNDTKDNVAVNTSSIETTHLKHGSITTRNRKNATCDKGSSIRKQDKYIDIMEDISKDKTEGNPRQNNKKVMKYSPGSKDSYKSCDAHTLCTDDSKETNPNNPSRKYFGINSSKDIGLKEDKIRTKSKGRINKKTYINKNNNFKIESSSCNNIEESGEYSDFPLSKISLPTGQSSDISCLNTSNSFQDAYLSFISLNESNGIPGGNEEEDFDLENEVLTSEVIPQSQEVGSETLNSGVLGEDVLQSHSKCYKDGLTICKMQNEEISCEEEEDCIIPGTQEIENNSNCSLLLSQNVSPCKISQQEPGTTIPESQDYQEQEIIVFKTQQVKGGNNNCSSEIHSEDISQTISSCPNPGLTILESQGDEIGCEEEEDCIIPGTQEIEKNSNVASNLILGENVFADKVIQQEPGTSMPETQDYQEQEIIVSKTQQVEGANKDCSSEIHSEDISQTINSCRNPGLTILESQGDEMNREEEDCIIPGTQEKGSNSNLATNLILSENVSLCKISQLEPGTSIPETQDNQEQEIIVSKMQQAGGANKNCSSDIHSEDISQTINSCPNPGLTILESQGDEINCEEEEDCIIPGTQVIENDSNVASNLILSENVSPCKISQLEPGTSIPDTQDNQEQEIIVSKTQQNYSSEIHSEDISQSINACPNPGLTILESQDDEIVYIETQHVDKTNQNIESSNSESDSSNSDSSSEDVLSSKGSSHKPGLTILETQDDLAKHNFPLYRKRIASNIGKENMSNYHCQEMIVSSEIFSKTVSPSRERNIVEKAGSGSGKIRISNKYKKKLTKNMDIPEDAEDDFKSEERATRTYRRKKHIQMVLQDKSLNMNDTAIKKRVVDQLSSPCKVALTDICALFVQPIVVSPSTSKHQLNVCQCVEVSKTECIGQTDNVRQYKGICCSHKKNTCRSPSIEHDEVPNIQAGLSPCRTISNVRNDVSPGKKYKRILSFEKKKKNRSPSIDCNKEPTIQEELSPCQAVRNDHNDVSPGKKYKKIFTFDREKTSRSPSTERNEGPNIQQNLSSCQTVGNDHNDVSPGKKYKRILSFEKKKKSRSPSIDCNKEPTIQEELSLCQTVKNDRNDVAPAKKYKRILSFEKKKKSRSPSIDRDKEPTIQEELSSCQAVQNDHNDVSSGKTYKRILTFDREKTNRPPSIEYNEGPNIQENLSCQAVRNDHNDDSPGKKYKRIISFDDWIEARVSRNEGPNIKEEVLSPYKTIRGHQSDVSPEEKYNRNSTFDVKNETSISPSSIVSNNIGENLSNDDRNDDELTHCVQSQVKKKHRRTRCLNEFKGYENDSSYRILQVNGSRFHSARNGGTLEIKEKFDESSLGEEKGNAKTKGNKTLSKKQSAIRKMEDTMKELVKKKELISQDLLNRITSLNIKIDWELSSLHSQSSTISRKVVCNDMKNLDIELGQFDKKDCETIYNRWLQFCKEYGFKETEYTAFIPNKHMYLSNKEKLKFVQYISRDFPFRPLYAVYNKFETLCCQYRTGPFSEEESQLIWALYCSGKEERVYDVCSKILNRSRYQVYRRLKRMLKKKNPFSVMDSKYSSVCDENFFQKFAYMMKSVYDNKGDDTDTSKVNKEVFKIMSQDFKVPLFTVKKMWVLKVCPRMCSSSVIMKHKLQADLITLLMRENWLNWDEIKWKKLSRSLHNLRPVYLYVQLCKLIRTHVPEVYWKNFKKCVKILYLKGLPIIQRESLTIDKSVNEINLEGSDSECAENS